MPLQVRAMLLAGDRILAAGWIDSVAIDKAAAPRPDAGTPRLWILSTEDGRRVAEIELDCRPAFDGMIAAAGRVYMATVDGRVVCLGE